MNLNTIDGMDTDEEGRVCPAVTIWNENLNEAQVINQPEKILVRLSANPGVAYFATKMDDHHCTLKINTK